MSGSVSVLINHEGDGRLNIDSYPTLEELMRYKLIVESTQNPIATIDTDCKIQMT